MKVDEQQEVCINIYPSCVYDRHRPKISTTNVYGGRKSNVYTSNQYQWHHQEITYIRSPNDCINCNIQYVN